MADNFNAATPFSDLSQGNLELGVELYRALQVDPDYVAKNPQVLDKLRKVTDYLSDDPDPVFTLHSVIRKNTNPNIDNLDYMLTYVMLKEKKGNLTKEIERTDKDLTFYE